MQSDGSCRDMITDVKGNMFSFCCVEYKTGKDVCNTLGAWRGCV